MDDYEFDANLDRLGYELDCKRLNALGARSDYQALGSAGCSSVHQIAAARDRCQQLEQRCHALQRIAAELGVGRTAYSVPSYAAP